MKLFISYHLCQDEALRHTSDESFATQVALYLRRQSPLNPYFFSVDQGPNGWADQVAKEINEADSFVLFAGSEFGGSQSKEADVAWHRHQAAPLNGKQPLNLLVVSLMDGINWPGEPECQRWVDGFREVHPIKSLPSHLTEPNRVNEAAAQRVAHEICQRLGKGTDWRFDFDVPYGYPFAYEKHIIKEFVS